VGENQLDDLPFTFTFAQVVGHTMSERKLYQLRRAGLIEPIGRGLYRRCDAPTDVDLDLLEIAFRAPRATLCLTTALARHGLVDIIPAVIDIALPRGSRRPPVTAAAGWHLFDLRTFDLGREELVVEPGVAIGLYSAERSLADVARLRYLDGSDVLYEALKRWLRMPSTSPSALLNVASHFPRAETVLRQALEILL